MCATENRSGNKNSSTAFPVVKTQKQRAAAFARYVKSVASLPYTIGAHWFQFSDEPANGRGDGENFNMGLVDIDGRPYEELTSASSSLKISALRANANDPLPAESIHVPMVAELPVNTLRGWVGHAAALPVSGGTPFGDMFVSRDASSLYLGLYAMDYMDESLYSSGHIPEVDRDRWQVRLDGLAKPIDIRYGGKGKHASINTPGIEIHEAAGVKYTVILKIPMQMINGSRPVHLAATLDTHGRSSTMSWKAKLDMEGPK
jgi:hypothetical protein